MLTAADRDRIQSKARAAVGKATMRVDTWWAQPLITAVVLLGFVAYATWAGFQGRAYYAEPYISPMYAPCIAANCAHVTFPIVGAWWRWSPALLVIIFPLGFRLTCYFYRRVYYRSFLLSPPACAVGEPAPRYSGESRQPFILMNIHRYFFMVAVVLAVLHFYDLFLAFQFEAGLGIGLGTGLMALDSVLLAAYVFSCHSCRHLIGGRINRFSAAPLRHRLWRVSSRLNRRHGPIAWASLTTVVLVDLYVRGLASGWFTDPRIIF